MCTKIKKLSYEYIRLLIVVTLFVATLPNNVLGKKKDTSQVEWIKVYFNAKADHSVQLEGNTANDEWDMIGVLVNQIDSAQHSVDLAVYDLQHMRVGMALARAKRRGLRVRVITDVIHRNHAPRFLIPMWDTLRKAGIPSLDDSGTIYWPDGSIDQLEQKLPNSGANMHHKFAVFDALSPDPNDDYIWTGTMNTTYTGAWNTNSTLLIKDSGVTGAYLEEFEQMWGSHDDTPNNHRARFHKDKENVSENIHYVNDTKIEVYFGPIDRDGYKPSISSRITDLINEYARHDVHFLAFAISPTIPISEAMIERSGRGEITLEGVIDPAFYKRYQNNGAIWAQPEMAFGNRNIMPGKEVRKLHAKTIIIDANYPYPEQHRALTITGSYNFSANAEKANDENILMIYDNEIANLYYQDFMGVMNRAKGLQQHRFPPIDTTKWYDRFRVKEGDKIEVELETNVYYPVELLGVDAPRSWAGHKDSTYFYAAQCKNYLDSLLTGMELKISGARGLPRHKYGSYKAYISAKQNDSSFSLNANMIASGNARYSPYYYQPEERALLFKVLEERAQIAEIGMWKYPEKVGTKTLTTNAEIMKNAFPLNINTASLEELQLLPTVGPGRAKTIMNFILENGEIESLKQLDLIPGIGPATIEKLAPLIVFE
jgi:competence ComEA-like helix-hairpin-helix protein